MSEVVIACEELTLAVGGKILCRDLSWQVTAGSWWAVLGPNGVGKSTLLATLAGLTPAASGSVVLAGRPLLAWPARELAKWRGWLGQNPLLSDDATVWEAVLIGRHPHVGRWGWEGARDWAIARAALAETDLVGLEERLVATLSGGERQRVAIAALFTQQPHLYLLDEPTNHLDLRHQLAIFERLEARRREGAAIVTALHDPNWAARYATGVVLMDGQGSIEVGAAAVLLTAERLSALYGLPLVACGTNPLRHFVPASAAG